MSKHTYPKCGSPLKTANSTRNTQILSAHQLTAIEKLRSGSILCGGVGSGKSRTALGYFAKKECKEFREIKNLYIITTAKKRDSHEWDSELFLFGLSTDPVISFGNKKVVIDSWNNIKKYENIKNSFFIFDEQKVVGAGAWVKAFIKISKTNNWILLTATPGDTWMDYIPVLIANGHYKNRTEFLRRHVVYSNFTKFPKIDHYVETARLSRLTKEILVFMPFTKNTIPHHISIETSFDKNKFNLVLAERWNVYEEKPISNVSEYCYLMRRVVNSDQSRCEAIKELFKKHKKLIIFYNFNYELEILRELVEELNVVSTEWNGWRHEEVPVEFDEWIYLVQYTAGAEAWECIETDTIVFYSQNYSYKIMIQSAGRIDRLNTKFKDLYYYHLCSKSFIDFGISKCLDAKKNFNERQYESYFLSHEKHII